MARPSATGRLWQGVRMRPRDVAPDPDGPSRAVTVPIAWGDAAAVALAELSGGTGRPVALAAVADRWLAPLAALGGAALAARAHTMLLGQVAALEAAAWGAPGVPGRYRLNLGAVGFDEDAVGEVATDALACVGALWPDARPALVLTGLAAMLARDGFHYGEPVARERATQVVRRLRAAAPGAWVEAGGPDPTDALLGVETAGIAPAFSPLDATGGLSQASRALLAARGLSAEAALAAALAGEAPLPVATPEAYAAMHAALRPLLDAMPELPTTLPRPPARRSLPGRRGGIARRAVVGGQKLYFSTGEYADGTVGDVSIGLPQATPAVRALTEALGQVVGIGLQHGAPLAEFVDALAGTRFAPAGVVEGDPAVARATSPLDYLARALAAAYLPGMVLPPAEAEPDESPPLPLQLTGDAPRRRGLRVVK